jgi:hypothetical protein
MDRLHQALLNGVIRRRGYLLEALTDGIRELDSARLIRHGSALHFLRLGIISSPSGQKQLSLSLFQLEDTRQDTCGTARSSLRAWSRQKSGRATEVQPPVLSHARVSIILARQEFGECYKGSL